MPCSPEIDYRTMIKLAVRSIRFVFATVVSASLLSGQDARTCGPTITGTWVILGDPFSELAPYEFTKNGQFRVGIGGYSLLTSPYSVTRASTAIEIRNPGVFGVTSRDPLRLPITRLEPHRMRLEIPLLGVTRVYERRPLRYLGFAARSMRLRDPKTVGHAFAVWYTLTGDHTEVQALGFYPSKGAKDFDLVVDSLGIVDVPGFVVDEFHKTFVPSRDVEFIIAITEEEYYRTRDIAIERTAASARGDATANYDFLRNNCLDFLKSIVAAANHCGQRLAIPRDWQQPYDYVVALKSINRELNTAIAGRQ